MQCLSGIPCSCHSRFNQPCFDVRGARRVISNIIVIRYIFFFPFLTGMMSTPLIPNVRPCTSLFRHPLSPLLPLLPLPFTIHNRPQRHYPPLLLLPLCEVSLRPLSPSKMSRPSACCSVARPLCRNPISPGTPLLHRPRRCVGSPARIP